MLVVCRYQLIYNLDLGQSVFFNTLLALTHVSPRMCHDPADNGFNDDNG